MCRYRRVVAAAIIHAAQGLNPCFDPATDAYVCEPASNRIELEGCGVTQDDADDLATCLVIARKAGATELNFGDSTDNVIVDDDFFARLDTRTTEDDGRESAASALGTEEGMLTESQPHVSTFFDLASERFDSRGGGGLDPDHEENATFERLQLIRVPKAGSSEASVIARLLGGCTPRGPCCFQNGKAGSCPEYLPPCPAVVGCHGHQMGAKENRMLGKASVFSMSHLRDIVDRLVSGFFYGSNHSPECAKEEIVDYEECFLEMTSLPRYQNVASRMFAGHYAYDGDVRLCLREDSEDCEENLESVLAGACNLNFIILTYQAYAWLDEKSHALVFVEIHNVGQFLRELWQSSILLLFETLPWLRPTLDFFPVPQPAPDAKGSSFTSNEGPNLETQEYIVSRRNDDAKHDEGIKQITPELRNSASRANPVDNVLHEFVSAKFCHRFQETGLLQHPLVATELATYELLRQRCMDDHWVNTTLAFFAPLIPEDCRLYRPFTHP